MEWLPASIFSVVVGIIAFFLKKTYANFETKMSEMRKDSDEKLSCLREGFQQESQAIEDAVSKVLDEGFRTGDIMSEGCTRVSCSQMGDLIAARI